MKKYGYAVFGIAAAIIITLLCAGCTEKITEESENMTMFVDVNMHDQSSEEDPCIGTITMWIPDKSKVASAFHIKWWGFEWRNFPTYSSSYSYDQTFRPGTQNLEVSAEAWDEKGKLIGEYHDTGKYIGCMGDVPGDEEITLVLDYITPDEPKCEKILARWRGGNGPYDLLKNGFPENDIPIDGYSYGTISSKGDDWQIVDSSGNESNVETWTAPEPCY